jgi:hypothetical protein
MTVTVTVMFNLSFCHSVLVVACKSRDENMAASKTVIQRQREEPEDQHTHFPLEDVAKINTP